MVLGGLDDRWPQSMGVGRSKGERARWKSGSAAQSGESRVVFSGRRAAAWLSSRTAIVRLDRMGKGECGEGARRVLGYISRLDEVLRVMVAHWEDSTLC